MKCNVGGTDRIIRILLGIILVLVGWFMLEETAKVVAIVVGVVLVFTAITRRCLLYYPLGINTAKGEEGC